ncbi:MAG: hypothetical protein EXQ94_12305 [Alphaproteobacteria bacterium]|nr:hypothetical protein [Alphaproteobacteria bacterium]
MLPPLGLCPCKGGVLELSGVFGGSFSLARSATFSSRNAAFSASKAATRATNSSTRDSSLATSASLSAALDELESTAGVMETLTHIATPVARKITVGPAHPAPPIPTLDHGEGEQLRRELTHSGLGVP